MNLLLPRLAYAGIFLACCVAGHLRAAAAQDATFAPRSLEAAYAITFARVSVGAASLNAELEQNKYAVTADGHAGGIMRFLLNGSASLKAQGVVRDGRLVPTSFASNIEAEAEIQRVRMVLDDGNVKELELTPPIGAGAIPDEERKGVVDPLSAMLLPAPGRDGASPQDACRRTLRVFDGRLRYDLRLAFKRMDKLSGDQGYKGLVLVCALTYVPIAGHGSTTPLVRYLSEGREMEVAFAPVSATPVLAPVRFFVASMVANLMVSTTRFETRVPAAPGPATPVPGPN